VIALYIVRWDVQQHFFGFFTIEWLAKGSPSL
jgi:hypothetical protein